MTDRVVLKARRTVAALAWIFFAFLTLFAILVAALGDLGASGWAFLGVSGLLTGRSLMQAIRGGPEGAP
jgi:hypothetical protein